MNGVKKRLKETKFLGMTFPHLELPGEVKAILNGQSLRNVHESSDSRLVPSSKQVQELVALETKLQCDFFALKQRFGVMDIRHAEGST